MATEAEKNIWLILTKRTDRFWFSEFFLNTFIIKVPLNSSIIKLTSELQ